MRYDSLPIEQLHAWAQFNGVTFGNITVAPNVTGKDGVDKGAGLIASVGFSEDSATHDILLAVPADLVLSREAVILCAKADSQLKEILDVVGDFAQSPRKAIVLFLLVQLARTCPELAGKSPGVTSPFADYVRLLPKSIPLPTFYTDEQRRLLFGTSLSDALDQKFASLDREFEELRGLTSNIEWCQKHWWDDEEGVVTLDDWKLADAMYRSRALDLPNIGHAMVPVLDMANHVSDNKRNARFEVASDGGVLLVREHGVAVKKDEELNITYGAGGACETIFSYGFLDEGATSARELFLSLDIPQDDPLRIPKKAAAEEAPGVRVFADSGGAIQWDGALIWWSCVNEEDGLDFQVIQTQDGARELRTLWRNEEFLPSDFRDKIASDEKFDIFRLRATVLVQERVAEQGAALIGSEEEFEEGSQQTDHSLRDVLNRLRRLEVDLLTSAYEALEKQKAALLQSDTVVRYLSTAITNQEESTEIDGNTEDGFL